MKTKLILTLLFSFLFYNNAFTQLRNKFYIELHTLRFGQSIEDNYTVTNGHQFGFFNGVEVGYGLLDQLMISAKIRKNSSFDIVEPYFENPINHRLEWSVGMEYVREFKEKFHIGYGFGYFQEEMKFQKGLCYIFPIPFSLAPPSWENHRRVYRGGFFQINLNHHINSNFYLIISSRYRLGLSKVYNGENLLTSETNCNFKYGKKENLELLSKVAVRYVF